MATQISWRSQHVQRANRRMFLWVTAASILVGICLVVGLILGQRIIFMNKVIGAKVATEKTLKSNIAAIPQLRDNIRVMDTNDSLKSVRINDTDRPIQSVLDALPADANDTALGSSLATKIVGAIPGVTLESITIQPVSEDAELDGAGLGEMNFTLAVSVGANNMDAFRQLLARTEKSIRVFEFTGISIESTGTRQVMTLTGKAFYAPAKTIQLQEKVIR